MNRITAGISTVATTAALLLTGSPASQAVPSAPAPLETGVCADPVQPIARDMGSPDDLVVGTTKVKTIRLDLYTYEHCPVTGATATVRAPRTTTTVTLRHVGTGNGYVHWQGALSVSPRSLRNSDAGSWPVVFVATGEHRDSVLWDVSVVRASRLSFDAGPEPVVGDRLTFSGRLERASWDSRRYLGHANRTVDVFADLASQPEPDYLGAVRTRSDGTYRMSQAYRGPGEYQADVSWTSTTAGAVSRIDAVTTP